MLISSELWWGLKVFEKRRVAGDRRLGIRLQKHACKYSCDKLSPALSSSEEVMLLWITCTNTFIQSDILQCELSCSAEFYAFFSCWVDDMKTVPNTIEKCSWAYQSKGPFFCIQEFVWVCVDWLSNFYIPQFSISGLRPLRRTTDQSDRYFMWLKGRCTITSSHTKVVFKP